MHLPALPHRCYGFGVEPPAPQYVVLHSNDTLPMLTVYANRYSAAVTSQLMAACQRIKENPRHDREHADHEDIAFIRS